MEYKRSQWVGNIGFTPTAVRSVMEPGNIWRSPGKVAAGGGGALLICCALIVLLVGSLVMLAELSIGCSTQKNVVGAFHRLSPCWSFAGGVGILTLFVIISYYSVVGGWVMKYTSMYLTRADFSALGNDNNRFSAYSADLIPRSTEPLLWGTAFLFLCIYMVVRGVSEGTKRISKFLMPGLFVLSTGIAVYAITPGGVAEGLKYMLVMDSAKLDGGTVIAVLGQALFSLSVGMGTMAIYGSYVLRTRNLVKSAGCIYILDSPVVLLSGFTTVSVAYTTAGPGATGMGSGSALVVLPKVFSWLPGGVFFGSIFFLLLLAVTLTSTISILENYIAWFVKELGLTRLEAILLFVTPMSFLSAGYSLSWGTMDIKLPWLGFTNGVRHFPMNAVTRKSTDNLMVPLGALHFCLLVGWVWGTDNASKETEASGYSMAQKRLWAFPVKLLALAVITVILHFTVGRGQGLF